MGHGGRKEPRLHFHSANNTLIQTLSRRSVLRRPSLLIIDDSASFRELLAHDLANRGYEVFEAASGPEGLAAFASRKRNNFV